MQTMSTIFVLETILFLIVGNKNPSILCNKTECAQNGNIWVDAPFKIHLIPIVI